MRYIAIFIFILLIIFGTALFSTEKEAEVNLEPLIIDLEEVIPEHADSVKESLEEEKRVVSIASGETAETAAEQELGTAGEAEIAASDLQPETEEELGEAVTVVSFTEINQKTKEALVNIYCAPQSGVLRAILGSGIFIDERGVILTNAHIAQYFLLKDYLTEDFVNCVIKTGNPAKPAYRADLLYIPPEWIENNTSTIIDPNPSGTGEDDYAFLLIQEHVDSGKKLPEAFPSVEFDIDSSHIKKGELVLIAGYPAGFLSSSIAQRELYSVSTITPIKELFTFTASETDILSTGGNLAAQKGASGGAVMSPHNKLIGMVVTSTSGETTDDRDLHAITIAYIDRSLIQHTGGSVEVLLGGNLQDKAALFNKDVAPALTKLLTDELDK